MAHPPTLGFRRRCAWCGVQLRGWQLNLCRRCKRAVKWDEPGPPVQHGSRWDSAPDQSVFSTPPGATP